MEPENYGEYLAGKYDIDTDHNGDWILTGDYITKMLGQKGWTKTTETKEEKKLRIRKERINTILNKK